jgi:hypothetical protein
VNIAISMLENIGVLCVSSASPMDDLVFNIALIGYSRAYAETYIPHILTNVCDEVYRINRQLLGGDMHNSAFSRVIVLS